ERTVAILPARALPVVAVRSGGAGATENEAEAAVAPGPALLAEAGARLGLARDALAGQADVARWTWHVVRLAADVRPRTALGLQIAIGDAIADALRVAREGRGAGATVERPAAAVVPRTAVLPQAGASLRRAHALPQAAALRSGGADAAEHDTPAA